MENATKIEYQKSLESYLEEYQVYDLFTDLLNQLIIEKPNDPVDYLKDILKNPPPKRVFILGPPGCGRKEFGLSLADFFGCTCISVSDILEREAEKTSQYSQEIRKAKAIRRLVRDEIVIDLVKKDIDSVEKKRNNWIIEGFPRTRTQAIYLQRSGLIPDRFVVLSHDQEEYREVIKSKIFEDNIDKEELANESLKEYEINLEAVKQLYQGFWHPVDTETKTKDVVLEDIAKILKIKLTHLVSRRPPHVVILGAPGSGRSTQARLLARKYGLIHISPKELLRDEIRKKSEVGKLALKYQATGDLVPDAMIIPLLESRLLQTDCIFNGWVIDGFPKTSPQVEAFSQLKMPPSLVVILEVADSIVYERLENKRFDPMAGKSYDIIANKPTNPEIERRLVQNPEDTHDVIKKRLTRWKATAPQFEAAFGRILLTVSGDREPVEIADIIGDAIENPLLE
eukprot:CAMPEP_0114990330 /NCGR_PEP_ID=MMETSP0216-20121206/10728_1 /TAXON_ID=223996 /ORGANISM="Protocruzia adherens, Strain Boccale" /LENGTH=454 /DNA_ID=CAMNT_0002353477 /DNA_START=37 /DNA_END=1401 /DNA_ORIENTATION=+